MGRVRHNPRCAIFSIEPGLRDDNDCNCGAIPPLTGRTKMPESCPYCGSTDHRMTQCPRVKSVEYHPGGGVKKVELHDEKPEVSQQPPEDHLHLQR